MQDMSWCQTLAHPSSGISSEIIDSVKHAMRKPAADSTQKTVDGHQVRGAEEDGRKWEVIEE